jgi:uncharacterized membrane-anchored protein YitT (DUF2179 family)
MGKRKRIWKEIRSYIIITFGIAVYVIAWVVFLMPNHLVGGGVSGIGALIEYATGFKVSYTYFIINIILLLLALKILGRGFGVKTVFAIFVTTFFFRIFPEVVPQDFINEISIENGKLLAAMIGGVLAGAGIGITFMQGGSSGGTDIIALIINKYRNISPGKVILTIDMVIIACSFFVSQEVTLGKKLATVLYGYIAVGLTGYTVDMLLSGARQSLQFFIFSKKHEEIAERITKEMGRGVTIITAQGWHTKAENKVLMVIARKTESNIVFSIIKEIDRSAFLSVGNVMGVYGQGFEQIKG